MRARTGSEKLSGDLKMELFRASSLNLLRKKVNYIRQSTKLIKNLAKGRFSRLRKALIRSGRCGATC